MTKLEICPVWPVSASLSNVIENPVFSVCLFLLSWTMPSDSHVSLAPWMDWFHPLHGDCSIKFIATLVPPFNNADSHGAHFAPIMALFYIPRWWYVVPLVSQSSFNNGAKKFNFFVSCAIHTVQRGRKKALQMQKTVALWMGQQQMWE